VGQFDPEFPFGDVSQKDVGYLQEYGGSSTSEGPLHAAREAASAYAGGCAFL
jgi:hypothetical protein